REAIWNIHQETVEKAVVRSKAWDQVDVHGSRLTYAWEKHFTNGLSNGNGIVDDHAVARTSDQVVHRKAQWRYKIGLSVDTYQRTVPCRSFPPEDGVQAVAELIASFGAGHLKKQAVDLRVSPAYKESFDGPSGAQGGIGDHILHAEFRPQLGAPGPLVGACPTGDKKDFLRSCKCRKLLGYHTTHAH